MRVWGDMILEYMKNYNKKQVYAIDIEDYLRNRIMQQYEYNGGYFGFAEVMNKLVEKGNITPIKSRGHNHQNPPVYIQYKLVKKEKEKNLQHIKRIMTEYPGINMSAFFEEDIYLKWKYYIDPIHSFLHIESDTKRFELKANERSFELFKEEKFLLSKEGDWLLSRLGITLNDLNCRKSYEPFFEYRNSTEKPKNILIVENKDTFDSVKDLMKKGVNTWNGVKFEMIIYGEGDKIQRSYEFLTEYHLGEYNVHYFGDLDAKGIWICSELMKMDENVRPFVPFYIEMLDRYGDEPSKRKLIKPLKESNIKESLQIFLSHFEHEYHEKIKNCVKIIQSTQYYIPQEGLNLAILYYLSKGK
ncbi:Wadjet anti-phage system protein JetD domain-containing protein [Gottfriedia sp. NPDC057991]|uniref:Wadjet anti-phage system protein JetD domain-containing protein n=1 Tax=Gottfriedia sp. NPDC057991 TaxID=3346298 RepID=UPI0036DC3428